MEESNKQIPLEQAQLFVGKWKETKAKINKKEPVSEIKIKGFLITQDVVNALTEAVNKVNGQGIRAYLGIEEFKELDEFGMPKQEFKLLMVGVDSNGKDMVAKEESAEAVGNSGVYNYTIPCPSDCDQESPLNI
jgi:hypothetical protein